MMEFQPVVMAAGPGSRMTDLTVKCPKALLPIGNKPMVWYPINMLERAGFEEAIVVVPDEFCTNFQKELIEICAVKIKLDFVSLSDSELGTADVLRMLKEKDKIKADLLIVSCDLITDVSLHSIANIHRTYDASVTLLLSKQPLQFHSVPAPGVKTKKRLDKEFIGFDEKTERILFMTSEADVDENVKIKKHILRKHPCITMKSGLTDCHLYLMSKWVVDYLLEYRSLSDIKGELIPHLVRKQFKKPKRPDKDLKGNQSIIVEEQKTDILNFLSEDQYSEQICDMTSWIDHHGDMADCYHGDKIRCYAYIQDGGICLRANTLAAYSESNKQIQRIFNTIDSLKEALYVHPSATIEEKSQVGPDCLIAEGARIGERVSIKKSVIGKHCQIGDKVKITNSVIMDHVSVLEGSNIQGTILSANSTVNEKCEIKDSIVGTGQQINAMGSYTNEAIVDIDEIMEI